MPETTVAIVQHRSALLDLNESLRRVATHIADAAAAGATLVVFPETWLTRYPAGCSGWPAGGTKPRSVGTRGC
jgi:nitrilase